MRLWQRRLARVQRAVRRFLATPVGRIFLPVNPFSSLETRDA